MSDDELSEDEYERINELCLDGNEAIERGRLTKWEALFIEDIAGTLAQFGKKTRLSSRQWEVIERLEKKVYQV